MTRIAATLAAAAILLVAVPCVFLAASDGAKEADAPEAVPSISEKVDGMTKRDGFFPFWIDERRGTVWVEVMPDGSEFLYQTSLTAGVGSNDIGLDRGKLGPGRVVRFERSGPRVLLVASNLDFRATGAEAAERRAVRESFAESVVAGFEVAAESGGRVLIDVGSLLMRDAFGVAETLEGTGQGDFSVDADRSALYLDGTKNFPSNSEFEVTLTFAGNMPGRYVREVTPDPRAITVRQRHSWIALPDDGYEPLPFDPESGFYSIRFQDYATPVDAPLVRRFVCRHRLERNADGTAVEPIVYYVDSGAPEPVRSALLEGARWWNQAFEAAGYRDAFRVELLPEDADPLDVRLNVIQWVHRATRGWSYGSSVLDPRTGEILKGHVSLGSLRVRQDFLIAEALLRPYADGDDDATAARELALARIRQLAAHEVGHTLGLVHNFAASVADRASVMDYPHPLAVLAPNGAVDVRNAYDTGIGEWDKVAIRFGYDARLDAAGRADVLRDATRRGIPFVTDADARPLGGAHPEAHLWDNGRDAVDELKRLLRLRRTVLDGIAEGGVLRAGAPLATIEETFVPAYLMHRYQIEAAVKVLGGVRYGYGDSVADRPRIADAGRQRDALAALLATLSAETLAVPESILRALPPRPPGYPRHRELFPRRTGVTFDPLAAAETAASMTLSALMHPQRAARLVEHHARDVNQPSLEEVLDEIVRKTWLRGERSQGLHDEIERVVDSVVLGSLLDLAESTRSSVRVRAAARHQVSKLDDALSLLASGSSRHRSHFAYAREVIRRYSENPADRPVVIDLEAPPGSPIGAGMGDFGTQACGCERTMSGLDVGVPR